ncbi:hypothetical protein [Streptomyces sp. NPDC088360]|uniref:hypothetical protein n=1 Tax=Streptomyces sp. NPDC088360 TaxID=3154515 RepID=UPI00344C31D5
MAYNDDERAIIGAAAARENMAPAAWAARAALAVAVGQLVPVPTDTREVMQELIESRKQTARPHNNFNQLQRMLNTEALVGPVELTEAVADRLMMVMAQQLAVLQRLDAATLQVMRERRGR